MKSSGGISRRTFVAGAGAGLVLAGCGGPSRSSAPPESAAAGPPAAGAAAPAAAPPTVAEVASPFGAGTQVIPFDALGAPIPENKRAYVGSVLDWGQLSSYYTPNDKFFNAHHYNIPSVTEASWKLDVAGLVERPISLTLDQLKRRKQREIPFTIECAGGDGFSWLHGLIGTAQWQGVSLAELLAEAGVRPEGREVVFVGLDAGNETVRGQTFVQPFARSMTVEEAMAPDNMLCWGMNGKALAPRNGFPVRLLVPGWYGIGNVKWLQRIEVIDRRYMGKWMAREYVTLRKETRDGKEFWMEKSVGRARIKSLAANVLREGKHHRVHGAAWGPSVGGIEVSIDGGPWRKAGVYEGANNPHAWKLWVVDWPEAAPGKHTVISRVTGPGGVQQPKPDHPHIAGKKTYWESNQQLLRTVTLS